MKLVSMNSRINVEEVLNASGIQLIDVRSEGEFAEDALPGALNLPLLDNVQRAAVGKTYKEQGVAAAKRLGMHLVAPKLPELIEKMMDLGSRQQLVLYCWRGGLRSKYLVDQLHFMGVPARQLIGGYKSYRRFVNSSLEQPLTQEIVVLHGLTGVGKTEVIEQLVTSGLPVIDLEALAENRGSAFGGVGMGQPPSQKKFDSRLYREMCRYADYPYLVVECESRRVGSVLLPQTLVAAMKLGKHILLYDTLPNRIARIKKIYTDGTDCNLTQLEMAVGNLKERLGGQKVAELQAKIRTGNFDETVEFLLVNYYDPLYRYPDQPDSGFELSVFTGNLTAAATQIRAFLDKTYSSY